MKIGIVSQWYPPEPAFVPGELAGQLAGRGHDVRVLTTFPSYPAGSVYPGYRQRWNDVTTTGTLTVRRVPAYPSHDESAVRRIGSYLSFAATSSVTGARYLKDCAAIYVYHPPPTSYAAAALLRLTRRIPTALHIQDMWPESVTASDMTPAGGVGRILDHTLSAMMRRIYRSAGAIIVISPAMAALVVERGADPNKVRVVLNWTDESLFHPVPATAAARAEIGHRGRCTVMFAGNIGPFQGVLTAVRAAAAADVDLVFVGSGTQEEAARRLTKELDATNIRFLGRRPPSEMNALYAAADCQLVMLRDLPALRGTVPSKLQAALAAGRPVIVSAAGDAAQIVDAAGAGWTSPPEDWRALAECFRAAAASTPRDRGAIGAAARQLYDERMSLRIGTEEIESMLIKLAAGRVA